MLMQNFKNAVQKLIRWEQTGRHISVYHTISHVLNTLTVRGMTPQLGAVWEELEARQPTLIRKFSA
jgi:hypothetical protein